MAEPVRRRPAPIPKPRFTLGIIYVMAFFFAYCFALAGPALWEVLTTVPPGPEQEALASRATQEALQSRLWIALAAAVATTALGMAKGWLPGTR
jgi:ABC-type Fe3+ transport system permease subunit